MIFTDYSDLQKYLGLNVSKNIDQNDVIVRNIEIHEHQAFYQYFRKYLGKTLINEISNAESSSSAYPAMFVTLLKYALAPLTYISGLPMMDVVLTANGFGVVSNNQIAPASQHRVDALKIGLQETANANLYTLLLYMQDNADLFSTWNRSTISDGTFVINNEDVESITKIETSPIDFYLMKPFLGLFRLKCNNYFTIAECGLLHGDNLSIYQSTLLEILQRTAAYTALGEILKNVEFVTIAANEFEKAKSYIKDNRLQFTSYNEIYVEPFKNETDKKIFLA